MKAKSLSNLGLLLYLLQCLVLVSIEASEFSEKKRDQRQELSWCTTNYEEELKCSDWKGIIGRLNELQESFEYNLKCVSGDNQDQCMSKVDNEEADMVLLDSGEIGIAGRYHSLVPIMAERYGRSRTENGRYSVAVVKKRSQSYITSLSDLKGKKACFSGVNHMASWILPIAAIVDLPTFEVVDCNNIVKSVSHFFGNSCAPNALISKFNPSGDNPQKIIQLCDQNQVGQRGSAYIGAFSALMCLSDDLDMMKSRSADVAFLPHTTVFLADKVEVMRKFLPLKSELELLCPQGGRQPLDRWESCNFGFAPASAVVVSSRKSESKRAAIQRFLKTSLQYFSSELSLPSSSLNPSSSTLRQSAPNLRSIFKVQQEQQLPPLDSRSFNPLFAQPQHRQSTHTQYTHVDNFKINGDLALDSLETLDVLFSTDMTDLVLLNGSQQTFKGYLNSHPVSEPTKLKINHSLYDELYSSSSSKYASKDNYVVKNQISYLEKLRQCPAPSAILCITSEKEYSKCQAMSKAFHAALLKPELNCKLAKSSYECMQLVHNREADLLVLDPADLYIAGLKFDLVSILSERTDIFEPESYVVAVAKKSENIDLLTLQGRKTCHSGFMTASGWVMPISYLSNYDKIRNQNEYECNSAKAAAEHFDKSCSPGILSFASSFGNTKSDGSWSLRNMCELCHGSGRSYCARDASEPFFGDTGAFRCLVEGGGEIAFMRNSAIHQNTGGSNSETWARNLIRSDFELLCRDGSRKPVEEFADCNLGKVPRNAIVTRNDSPVNLVEAYINLFLYGQQYYGSKYSEEYTFRMFTSDNAHDLIFQDSTQQLVRVAYMNRTYHEYLGPSLMRSMQKVLCI